MQKKPAFSFFLALVIWCSLVFFPVGGLLIEGTTSLTGPMGLLMLLLLLLLVAYVKRWKYADLAAFPILAAWGLLQFNAHWYTWILEAEPERLEHYYAYFQGTWRIFPESATHTVRDLYHFGLGLLILGSLVFAIAGIVPLFRREKQHA